MSFSGYVVRGREVVLHLIQLKILRRPKTSDIEKQKEGWNSGDPPFLKRL